MDANGKRISERVIGCAYEVSNGLGAGFIEGVYENALALEFTRNGLNYERQKSLDVSYRDVRVGHFVADFVVEELLIVELKALAALTREHHAQVMNYLRASRLNVGLLINFGTPRLGIRRVVWQHDERNLL